MGFMKNPLASGLLGSQLLKDKKKPEGSLVNQYGEGGGKPVSQSMVSGARRALY